jgi:alkylation response protein AidB-like acyl-CoA dehydrogenase
MAHDLRAQGAQAALLAFTPDETEIMSAAAGLAVELLPLERLQGAEAVDLPEGARHTLGELGWFGLSLPSDAGGSGLSAVEQAVFFREFGRQCGPLDILTQTLAVLVAAEAADLRSGLLAGDPAVALAVADGDGVRLFGAPTASFALEVESESATLLALDRETVQPRPGLDPATSLRLAPRPEMAVARRTGPAIWDLGQLGAAAMLVGIAETALSLIVDYAKVRETFGRKIGSYQAVRHPCADMAMRVEAARSQLWYAAAAMKGGRPDARAHLVAAKHLANEAALANADANIQLHGGIGVTEEHPAHLLLKRALLLGRLFGAKRALLGELLHARLED